MSRAAETNQLWESPASGRLPCNNPFFFVCLFVCLVREESRRKGKKKRKKKEGEERKKRWDRIKKKSPAEVALEMTKRQRKKKKSKRGKDRHRCAGKE